MAGIFGYIDKKNDDESKQQFLSIIKDAGLHIKKEIVGDDFILGEAGIDIDKSNNDDLNDTISIVSQGETFDDVHQDLSTRILDLYINNKLDELNMINGSFSAAIYDNHDKKLTIVNDINGLTKVFYAIGKDDFYFAPKITPLLRMGKGGALRKDAIADFFLFGYILGDNTFLDNMFQLPAGSILELTEDGISISQYSTLQYQEEELSNDKDPLIDELGNHWHKAVERRVAKEQKIIIPISGGLDSRAILAATLKCIPKENVVTFTFGEEGSLDFDIGKRVAKKAGVKHIGLIVEKEDYDNIYRQSMNDIEGFIDATPYFPVNGYRKMKDYGDIIFSGTKIDVLLGRHVLSNQFSTGDLDRKILNKHDYEIIKDHVFKHQILNDEKTINNLFKSSFLENFDIKHSYERSHPELDKVIDTRFPNYFADWDFNNRWNKYIYFAVFRNRDIFKYRTMLDTDLVNYCLGIPVDHRLDEKLYKQMLLKYYSDYFNIPTKNNAGGSLNEGDIRIFLRKGVLYSKVKINNISNKIIRKNVFNDRNKNYIDYDELLREDGEYRLFIKKYIDRVKEREYFSKEYIDRLWELEMKGKKNSAMLFGLLVTFELFLEKYIDT